MSMTKTFQDQGLQSSETILLRSARAVQSYLHNF